MERRRFLILSVTGVSILGFDLGCANTRQAQRIGESDLGADVRLHLDVLQSLFSPELVTPVVVHGTLHLDQAILFRLDLDQLKILALEVDAEAVARARHGAGFSALDGARRESVIALVLERPERLETYKSLRNLLFADPKYGIDPNGSAWRRLGYQSFDYSTDDMWHPPGPGSARRDASRHRRGRGSPARLSNGKEGLFMTAQGKVQAVNINDLKRYSPEMRPNHSAVG